MIVAHVADCPVRIFATETALLKNDPKTIGAVQYKPLVGKNTHITDHKDLKAKNARNLKLDWKSKTQPSNEYAEYSD